MATGSVSDGYFEKNPKQISYTLETALQIRRRSMTQPQIPHGYDAAPENAGELWRLPGLSHVPGVRSSRAGQDVAESKRCNQWSQASICSWRNWKPKWLNWMWKWNRTGKPCFSMLQQHAQIQQRLSEMSSMWPQERYGSGWNANHSWSNVETEAGNGSAWNRSWAREAL